MQDRANFLEAKWPGDQAQYREKRRVLWQGVQKEFNTRAKVGVKRQACQKRGHTPQTQRSLLSGPERGTVTLGREKGTARETE